jgi:predicted nuclease of predicted toxin-antitoxin system
MKLLFDENLSHKLPALVGSSFPDSHHVRTVGLKGSTDEQIWKYAQSNGFAIISKDKDFYERALFYGSPPKFIWLRLGNCTRDDVLNLINRRVKEIEVFETSQESILVLT